MYCLYPSSIGRRHNLRPLAWLLCLTHLGGFSTMGVRSRSYVERRAADTASEGASW